VLCGPLRQLGYTFSSSFNAFEKTGVSDGTVIINNISIDKQGQSISTIMY